jgi:hypothetical protein
LEIFKYLSALSLGRWLTVSETRFAELVRLGGLGCNSALNIIEFIIQYFSLVILLIQLLRPWLELHNHVFLSLRPLGPVLFRLWLNNHGPEASGRLPKI